MVGCVESTGHFPFVSVPGRSRRFSHTTYTTASSENKEEISLSNNSGYHENIWNLCGFHLPFLDQRRPNFTTSSTYQTEIANSLALQFSISKADINTAALDPKRRSRELRLIGSWNQKS